MKISMKSLAGLLHPIVERRRFGILGASLQFPFPVYKIYKKELGTDTYYPETSMTPYYQLFQKERHLPTPVFSGKYCLWIVGTVSHVLIRAYVAQEKELCVYLYVVCCWLIYLSNRLSAVSSFCSWPHLDALPQVALGPVLSRQRHGEPRPRCCNRAAANCN